MATQLPRSPRPVRRTMAHHLTVIRIPAQAVHARTAWRTKCYGAEAADAAGSGGLLRGNGTLPPTDTPTLPPPIGTPMPTPTPIDSQAASSVAAAIKTANKRFIGGSYALTRART
jgi:hypothetical protein